ncbi:uncharacterized protein LOC143021269 [Oratosquilla oratoria]|uniref:uncharacterized protein LOC143021269 n=1 Tax=Oratosquilla oratoria TaxID=337810 RepID=UPI003F76CAD3
MLRPKNKKSHENSKTSSYFDDLELFPDISPDKETLNPEESDPVHQKDKDEKPKKITYIRGDPPLKKLPQSPFLYDPSHVKPCGEGQDTSRPARRHSVEMYHNEDNGPLPTYVKMPLSGQCKKYTYGQRLEPLQNEELESSHCLKQTNTAEEELHSGADPRQEGNSYENNVNNENEGCKTFECSEMEPDHIKQLIRERKIRTLKLPDLVRLMDSEQEDHENIIQEPIIVFGFNKLIRMLRKEEALVSSPTQETAMEDEEESIQGQEGHEKLNQDNAEESVNCRKEQLVLCTFRDVMKQVLTGEQIKGLHHQDTWTKSSYMEKPIGQCPGSLVNKNFPIPPEPRPRLHPSAPTVFQSPSGHSQSYGQILQESSAWAAIQANQMGLYNPFLRRRTSQLAWSNRNFQKPDLIGAQNMPTSQYIIPENLSKVDTPHFRVFDENAEPESQKVQKKGITLPADCSNNVQTDATYSNQDKSQTGNLSSLHSGEMYDQSHLGQGIAPGLANQIPLVSPQPNTSNQATAVEDLSHPTYGKLPTPVYFSEPVLHQQRDPLNTVSGYGYGNHSQDLQCMLDTGTKSWPNVGFIQSSSKIQDNSSHNISLPKRLKSKRTKKDLLSFNYALKKTNRLGKPQMASMYMDPSFGQAMVFGSPSKLRNCPLITVTPATKECKGRIIGNVINESNPKEKDYITELNLFPLNISLHCICLLERILSDFCDFCSICSIQTRRPPIPVEKITCQCGGQLWDIFYANRRMKRVCSQCATAVSNAGTQIMNYYTGSRCGWSKYETLLSRLARARDLSLQNTSHDKDDDPSSSEEKDRPLQKERGEKDSLVKDVHMAIVHQKTQKPEKTEITMLNDNVEPSSSHRESPLPQPGNVRDDPGPPKETLTVDKTSSEDKFHPSVDIANSDGGQENASGRSHEQCSHVSDENETLQSSFDLTGSDAPSENEQVQSTNRNRLSNKITPLQTEFITARCIGHFIGENSTARTTMSQHVFNKTVPFRNKRCLCILRCVTENLCDRCDMCTSSGASIVPINVFCPCGGQICKAFVSHESDCLICSRCALLKIYKLGKHKGLRHFAKYGGKYADHQ